MKYITFSMVITTLIILQNQNLFGEDGTTNNSRYQLPTADYDDSVSRSEGRRKIMTGKQMVISRAIKRAKQRRTRIAMQKLSGRSITRPNLSSTYPIYFRNNYRLSNFYYPYSWNHPSQTWNNHGHVHLKAYFE